MGYSVVVRLPRDFLEKIISKHKLERLAGVKEVRLGVGGEERVSGRRDCIYKVL